MRVEENVWHHSAFCEWHVLGWPQPAQDAFLPVPAGKFVTDSWIPRDS